MLNRNQIVWNFKYFISWESLTMLAKTLTDKTWTSLSIWNQGLASLKKGQLCLSNFIPYFLYTLQTLTWIETCDLWVEITFDNFLLVTVWLTLMIFPVAILLWFFQQENVGLIKCLFIKYVCLAYKILWFFRRDM